MEGGRYDAAAVYLNDLYDYENDGFIGYGSWAFGLALEDWMRANDKGGLLEGLQARTVVREYVRTEAHLYGSSRLGMDTKEVILRKFNAKQVWNPFTESVLCLSWEIIPENVETHQYSQYRGNKRYELSNHLGNVLAVISDKLLPNATYVQGGNTEYGTKNHLFVADVVSATDYYAFGMVMPGRTFEVAGAYRYGFNGKEKEDGINIDNYDFGARIYDGRVGRWLSLDPKAQKYPSHSPYVAFDDNPIYYVDPTGEEPAPKNGRLILYSYYNRIPGEMETFKNAGNNLAKEYSSSAIAVTSGKDIVRNINAQENGTIKALDIIAHGGSGGIYFKRDNHGDPDPYQNKRNLYPTKDIRVADQGGEVEKEVEGYRLNWSVALKDYTLIPAKNKVMYNQNSASFEEINYAKFSNDAIVEFHACGTAEGEQNPALVLSKNLYQSGKTEAIVIGHCGGACPIQEQGKEDYRRLNRAVYHNGKKIMDWNKDGEIPRAEIDKALKESNQPPKSN